MIGAFAGIAYGLLEGVLATFLTVVPGALAWRNGSSSPILWVAPIWYGLAFSAVGLVFEVLTRLVRGIDWDVVLVFMLLLAGTYLAANVQGQLFSTWASVLLAAGVAFQVTRLYRKRRRALSENIVRTLPHLAAGVALLGLTIAGAEAAGEALALRRLPAAVGGRPNVILIVLDTLRGDHLSSYGYPRRTTPRLDRLAAEGVLFETAYANSSWTLPSHASLLTGRLVAEHRAGNLRIPFLDGRYPTLAEVLRAEGYATGGFVANTHWCGRQTGLDRGFLHYEDFFGSPGDGLGRTVIGRKLAYDLLPNLDVAWIPGRKRADRIGDDFLSWLDGLDGRPFFGFLNYMDVHGPYDPPSAYAGVFSGDRTPRRGSSLMELGFVDEDMPGPPPPEVIGDWIDRYDESLLFLDAQVGVLLDRLSERGILDRTLVIVTSDHGESWGEHGMVHHGNSLYREQIRVPLILRYPSKVPAGVRDSRPVGLESVPKTVSKLAGLGESVFTGTSLLADARRPEPREEPVLSEVSFRPGVPKSWPTSRGWIRSLATDRWHFILLESGEAELYDLRADPRELENKAGTAPDAAVAAVFRARLERLRPDESSVRSIFVGELLRRLMKPSA